MIRMAQRKYGLSSSDQRAICVAASVDPRTLTKALSGRPVRPMALARLRAELERRGQLELLPAPPVA